MGIINLTKMNSFLTQCNVKYNAYHSIFNFKGIQHNIRK